MEKPRSVTRVEPKNASSKLASKNVVHRKAASSNGVSKATLPNGKIEVLGVLISHPDRLIFKDPPVTKGELAEFYAAASQWMLKDIAGHPVSLLRCPEGTSGDCFYQRSPGTGLARTSNRSAGNIRESRTNISISKTKKA
jgi:bifunctional non-homologous end joining protein LigD